MKNIFAVFLYLVLLATSGQVLAGDCTSAANGNWGTFATWADGTALTPAAVCDGTSAIPAAGDNAIIAHAVIVAAAASITNLTVNTGKTLTLSAALTVTGTPTITGGIIYTTGTWPTAITTIGEKLTAGLSAAYTLPATVTSVGSLEASGNALTLAAANVVAGNVTISAGGSILGTLKLAPTGNQTITAIVTTGSTIPTLDLSGATAAKTISSAVGPLTLSAITFPSPALATKAITFTAGTSAAIWMTVPAATAATCALAGTAVTAGAYTVAAGTSLVCTVPATTGGGGGTVSAPIFSTKEKPAVFSEEVKN